MSADAAAQPLLASRTDAVVTLTLDRPEARNALNRRLVECLHEELDRIEEDTSVHAVVMTGTGRAFCAGADIKEMAPQDLDRTLDRVGLSYELYRRIPTMRVPVLAAVNGYALAGGCGLAMSCDVVLAADDAVFGYPEIGHGLVAAMVMVDLQRLVQPRLALELLLTGRRVDAAEACSIGMVNEVVPAVELMARATAVAEGLAARSPSSVTATKRLFHRTLDLPRDVALRISRDVSVSMRGAKGAAQGVRKFLDGKGSRR